MRCVALFAVFFLGFALADIQMWLPGGDHKVLQVNIEAAFSPQSPLVIGISEGKVCNAIDQGQLACGNVYVRPTDGRIICGGPVVPLPSASFYVRRDGDGLTYLYQRTIQENDYELWTDNVCGQSAGVKLIISCNNGQMFGLIYKGGVQCTYASV